MIYQWNVHNLTVYLLKQCAEQRRATSAAERQQCYKKKPNRPIQPSAHIIIIIIIAEREKNDPSFKERRQSSVWVFCLAG